MFFAQKHRAFQMAFAIESHIFTLYFLKKPFCSFGIKHWHSSSENIGYWVLQCCKIDRLAIKRAFWCISLLWKRRAFICRAARAELMNESLMFSSLFSSPLFNVIFMYFLCIFSVYVWGLHQTPGFRRPPLLLFLLEHVWFCRNALGNIGTHLRIRRHSTRLHHHLEAPSVNNPIFPSPKQQQQQHW